MANTFAAQTVTIDSSFTGAYAYGNSDNGGYTNSTDPNNNVLIIESSGMVGNHVFGARYNSSSEDVTGNSVFLNGGTVGRVYGGLSYDGNANGNSVFINGGSVDNGVYGGSADGVGKAINNTVTISGLSTLTGVNIYGGNSSGGTDVFTGNTLNVWTYEGTSVGLVQNFEFYNFVMSGTPPTGPVLDATNVYLGNGSGKDSVFTVSSNGGSAPWEPGDNITLLNNVSGDFDTNATGQHGATLSYVWTLEKLSGDLVATLDSVSVAPGAKALSEAFLAGIPLLNQTGDLIVKQTEKGDGVFFDMAGNWSRYDSGSHIDLAGLSLLTGISRRARVASGCLTYGAFFEYGTGSYDTFNSFATATAFRNNGNANHIGGGVLGRLDFRNCFYVDGSLRAGGLNNHFKGGDLRDALGTTATFDSKTAYYGTHFGAGRVYNFSKCAALDLYGRYFWTHQQGDTVTLSTLDPVKFSDVNSHRVRLGGRLGATNRVLNPYVGAAYEYEFDGEANASTYGFAIDAPSLRGSTGIGELGFTLKPGRNLLLDFGVQGYAGTRQGATAALAAAWRF